MPGLSRIIGALRRRSLKRVAVLPFEGDDAHTRRLARGLSDSVRDLMSRSEGLAVVGPASSRRTSSRSSDAPLQAAAELAADGVLTGSISTAERGLRVSTVLRQVADGAELWADAWSEEAAGLFSVGSVVAREVASAIGSGLVGPGEELIHREPTTDTGAYDLYLRGREALAAAIDGRSPGENVEGAAESFDAALNRDALFAPAWSALSECHRLAHVRLLSIGRSDGVPSIRTAAQRALEIDDTLPEALVSLGYSELSDWELSEAEGHLRTAIEIAPSHAPGHRWLARAYALRGDFPGAVGSIERAVALEPLSDIILNESGWVYALAGQPEEAKKRSRRVIHHDPEHVMAYFHLGQVSERLGKPGEAVTYFRAAAGLSERLPFLTAFLGLALVRIGDRQEAEDIARDLSRKARRGSPVATCLGALLVRLGEIEDGLRWLETALESKEQLLLTADTHWLPLPEIRSHPGFLAIKRQLPQPCAVGHRP